MTDLVTDAVRKLQLDDWWQLVHSSLNDMTTQDVADFGSDPTDPDSADSSGAFIRPALIVSDDRLHHPNVKLVIVVPGTSTLRI